MQDTDIPTKFQQAWAHSAGGSYIRSIPLTSQIGITNGAASFPDGFVPLNFTAVASGGVPPFGQDMNGILNQVTASLRWYWAAGPVGYDSTFSAAVGGYPKSALLTSATFGNLWMSSTDSNTTDPDASGAGWVPLSFLPQLAANQVLANITGSGAFPVGVSLAAFQAWLGLANKFTSSEIAISGPTASAAHGLGSTPREVRCVIRCKTAELGYSVGDEVSMPGTVYNGASGGTAYANSVSANATNVNIAWTGGVIEIANLSSGSNGTINNGNWRFVFYANT